MSTGLLRSAMDHSVPEVWRPGGGLKTVKMSSLQSYLFLALSRSLSLCLSLFLSSSCITIIIGAFSHPNIILKCLLSTLQLFSTFFTFFFIFSSSLTCLWFFLYVNLVDLVLHVYFPVLYLGSRTVQNFYFSSHAHYHESRASSSLWRWIIGMWVFILSKCCKSHLSVIIALPCRLRLCSQSLHLTPDMCMLIIWVELTPGAMC